MTTAPRPSKIDRNTTRVNLGTQQLTKKGASRYDWRDPYHLAVALSWRSFALMLLGADLAINLLFAGLYLIEPGAVTNMRPGSLFDAFFFSMETLATVGYGVMAPATPYGHVISAIEIICGMAFTAIMTGLLFVRFSKPKSRMLFADAAVVTRFNGRPTLMVRIANGRASLLTDGKAQLGALIAERSQEGVYFRRLHTLRLLRDQLPLLPLTWTLMHEIDAESPLFGMDAEALATAGVRLFITIAARDPTLATEIHDLRTYGPSEILFGTRYADAVSLDERGNSTADLTRIGDVEPDGYENDAPTQLADAPPAES